MSNLYPLKFKPIFLEKIWGGIRLKSLLNKDCGNISKCGESWEISGVERNISEVENGFLAGNTLEELVEIYMGDLVGEKVFKKFGKEFPLLIKFIDAADDLSVQVHPNDEISGQRHNAYGKTEMWYVVDVEKGALINSGFNQELSKEKYLEYIEQGKLLELLKFDEAFPGDVFFIPAGRIHSIGKGVLVAEIQQTSDVTYRIFDFNRKDANGNERELHNDLAIDAINYNFMEDYKTHYKSEMNVSTELVSCNYFTTNILEFNKELDKDYFNFDSFIIYMNLEGVFSIEYEGGTELVNKGETILIPASLETFRLKPSTPNVKTLEVYIK